jgi:hypothetical protein
LIERSLSNAANNHHFKRSRWRHLWNQLIQDHLIAAIQTVRILLKTRPTPSPQYPVYRFRMLPFGC